MCILLCSDSFNKLGKHLELWLLNLIVKTKFTFIRNCKIVIENKSTMFYPTSNEWEFFKNVQYCQIIWIWVILIGTYLHLPNDIILSTILCACHLYISFSEVSIKIINSF